MTLRQRRNFLRYARAARYAELEYAGNFLLWCAR